MYDLSFRALRFFLILCECGSVSRASAQIGIGQPGGSALLANLRRYFGDRLFVPCGRRMVPTTRATALVCPVRETLRLMDLSRNEAPFDPATSGRTFRLCMTDISQTTLLPQIYRMLQSISSGVAIEVLGLDARTPDLLTGAEADLAIGFITDIGPGFLQQRLLTQTYVCIARRGHPRLKSPMELDDYLGERHIHISAAGTGHGVVEKYLRRHKLARTVALTLPSFLGVGQIVARTDLIATVPVEMAREWALAKLCGIYELPFSCGAFAVRQYWHAGKDRDVGHRWLRTVVAGALRPGGRKDPRKILYETGRPSDM